MIETREYVQVFKSHMPSGAGVLKFVFLNSFFFLPSNNFF